MSTRRLFGALTAAALGTAAAGSACSSSNGNAATDAGGTDATNDTASGEGGSTDATHDTASGEDGSTDAPADTKADNSVHHVCTPDLPYTPFPWHPPSSWGQGACTQAQLDSFFADCMTEGGNVVLAAPLTSACTSFLANPANAACAPCLNTDTDVDAGGSTLAATYITSTLFPVTHVVANFGGCIAHEDGNSAAGGCGEIITDNTFCTTSECKDCDDISTHGPHTQACGTASTNAGAPCHAYDAQSCLGEVFDGGVASTCGPTADFTQWIRAWCGSPDGGAQDGGGGG